MEPIDIGSSSSDSDWDLDEYRPYLESDPTEPGALPVPVDTPGPSLTVDGGSFQEPLARAYAPNGMSAKPSSTQATKQRVLPPWGSTSGTSVTVNDGSSRKIPSHASGSNGISAKPSPTQVTGHRVLPSWGNTSSTSLMINDRSSGKIPSWGSVSNGSSLNRSYQSRAKLRNEQYTSEQGSKRALPTSMQQQAPSVRSIKLVENVGSSQMRESYGKPFLAQPKSTHGWNRIKNQSGRGSDDELVMYESSDRRILPSSFLHANPTPKLHHTSSVGLGLRSAAGEEKVVEYDERLIFQAALQDLSQPKVEATLPDGILTVSLLRHQKIALAWMLEKETKSCFCLGGILADDQGLGKTISMIALIQMQKFLQSKGKPEESSHETTEAYNLDDDGVNETTVLVQDKQDVESNDNLLPESSTSTREFRTGRPQGGTLVVAPASVLRQWARELEEKVAEEAKLNVLIYHGSNRTKDPVELAAYDVIVTTYALVAKEVPRQPLDEEDDDDHKKGERHGIPAEVVTNKKQKKMTSGKKRKKGKKGIDIPDIDMDSGALSRVRWNRVILDEAQTIKNHRTQVARSCCRLKAKVRWCLSGTPMQNAVDELFSYFRFLRYEPYHTYKSFCSTLKIPISRDSIKGYKKLYAVLRAVMLRRTKGTLIDGEPIITLPAKTIKLTKVEFSPEERRFYQKLEADSRSQFKAYAAAGTLSQNYANILLLLLRLRQACDHPLLVKGFTSDSVGRYSSQIAKNLPRDMLINLMKYLQTSSAICSACTDPPEDPIVTMCGHVFCFQCVSEFLRGDENTCPAPECKQLLGPDVVFSKSMLRSCISDDLDDNPSSSFEPEKSIVLRRDYISSKIKTAIDILKSHCKSNSPCPPLHGVVQCNGNSSGQGEELSDSGGAGLDAQVEAPRKAIVFSQWIGMLDLVEMALNQSGLRYRKLDGSMTLSARDNAVREFNTDPEVTVMLMSLKAGNLGLNMVAASHVILLDLWWNPATEDQAIDRAHRIGQTRPVTVSRLTIADSVEDRILALQEEKRKMVASAFGEDPSGGTVSRLTVEDLRYLFMGQ